jgi:phospholipid/cholesterol/gamma-HCH transport system permease protein
MEIGWRSLPLVMVSGFAIGIVLSLHTRSALVRFGSESLIPAVTALAVFRELAPLVTGLLISGRVGAGIGAELAEMRVTEQIDALESLAIDSFKYLAVTRIIACVISLPVLTIFTGFAGLLGGYVSEAALSHMSLPLFINRGFQEVNWFDYIPPTLKTSVFGFIIGTVSTFLGYTASEGAAGVGRASTSSVVIASFLVIITNVIVVKMIFFLLPEASI